MKKIWKRPQLQVLKRGKEEERVLVICKQADVIGAGPITNNSKCWASESGCSAACNVQSAS